jgi:hypothetical protein
MPTMVNRSAINADLILRSKGVSQAKEGDRLTSKSQGVRSSSISMSNPRHSKHVPGCGANMLTAGEMLDSPANNVLMIMSW